MSAAKLGWSHWEALSGERPYLGHGVVIVTASTDALARAALADLEGLFAHAKPRPRCLAVVEPAHARLGNLGGTLHAWALANEQLPDLRARLARGERVLVLHDAGRSLRAAPLSTRAGSRASVRLVGGSPGEPLTLLRLVAAHAQALATSAPGQVDVLWTGQLLLPDGPVRWPAGGLHKLALPVDVEVPRPADLGRFLADSAGIAEVWAAGSNAADGATHWDAGPIRIAPTLLDALLATLGLTDASFDADLVRPLAAGTASDAVASAFDRAGFAPRVGLGELGAGTVWQRYRRPDEVLEACLALAHDPRLRAAHAVRHPITGSRLGRVFVDGPELSWDEVHEGAVVGGVRVERSVVGYSRLTEGSVLVGSAMCRSGGLLTANASALVDSEVGEASADDALWYGLSAAPPAWNGPSVATELGAPPLVLQLPRPLPEDVLPLVDAERTRALLRPVLAVCDTLLERARPAVMRALCADWTRARASLPQLDDALSRLDLHDQAALTERALRLRETPQVPEQPTRIAVLSRVTLGADIAITAPLLQRLHERFPDAKLLLLGDERCHELLGGAPAVAPVLIHYPRRGALAERLHAWLVATQLLDELDADWVVSPDSRIDQLGTLPLGDRPCWVLPTTHLDHPRAHAEALNLRFDALLGSGAHASPRVWLAEPAAQLPPGAVALKLQVGGDASKALPSDAELALVRGLLALGRTVLLDRGFGERELAASDALLAKLPPAQALTEPLDVIPEAPLLTWTGGVLGWARLTAGAAHAISYDSVHGHLARALGLPTELILTEAATEDFATAWTPPGARQHRATDPLDVVAAVLDALR